MATHWYRRSSSTRSRHSSALRTVLPESNACSPSTLTPVRCTTVASRSSRTITVAVIFQKICPKAPRRRRMQTWRTLKTIVSERSKTHLTAGTRNARLGCLRPPLEQKGPPRAATANFPATESWQGPPIVRKALSPQCLAPSKNRKILPI